MFAPVWIVAILEKNPKWVKNYLYRLGLYLLDLGVWISSGISCYLFAHWDSRGSGVWLEHLINKSVCLAIWSVMKHKFSQGQMCALFISTFLFKLIIGLESLAHKVTLEMIKSMEIPIYTELELEF